jgi:hypothetical protein
MGLSCEMFKKAPEACTCKAKNKGANKNDLLHSRWLAQYQRESDARKEAKIAARKNG